MGYLQRLHVLKYLVCVFSEALFANRHAHQADALQGLCSHHIVGLVICSHQDLTQQRNDLHHAAETSDLLLNTWL